MMIGKMKVLLLTLGLLSVAAAAQASPLFPFAPGYTATYSCSQGSQTWTAKIQITGTANLYGYQWGVTNLINWRGDGTTESTDWRVSDTALYDSHIIDGPFFQTGLVNSNWTFTWIGNDAPTTVTIVAIAPVKVPAGTFSNVYEVHRVNSNNAEDEYMYWKPGVGVIKDVDYSGDNATNPVTGVLTSLSLGAKTAALGLLLGN